MRRAFLPSLLAGSLLGIVLAIAGPVPCDLTGDGLVDGTDVTSLEGILSGKTACPEGARCDLDGDREVAEADLRLLRQVVAGDVTCPADSPPCPAPKQLETTVELCVVLHPDLAEELLREGKNRLQVQCEEHCRTVAGCHLRLRDTDALGPMQSERTGKCDHNLPSFSQSWRSTCRCRR